jgi:ApeA N-terminal domain 1/Apea-like HEPN
VIEMQTYRGLWWLPSAPEDKHEGTLTVTGGDPRLDLLGHFGRELIGESDRDIQYSMWLSDQERIVGVSTDGRYVTMVDCTQASGGGLRFPGMETSVYRARAVIEGAAFEDNEPVEFDDFEIRVSALETWLRFMPARFQVNEDGSRAAIDVTHPQPLEFTLDDGTIATVRFSWRFGGFAVGSTKVEYEWAAWLGLKFNEHRSLSDVATAVGWLRNLITLATGKPTTLLAVDTYRDDIVDGHEHPVTMHLFYPLSHNPEPSQRAADSLELIFDFSEVGDRFADVLNRWLGLQERYEPVMGLFFGTIYQATSYREQRFLQYAQAIETYDRLKRPEARIRDRDEHKAFVAEIVEAVPEEHRNWLKGELAWSNDLKLAQRIEHVLGGCPNVAARIVGPEGFDAFVKAVKWTRNYYTHYDPSGRERAATEGRDMHRLTVQLRAVLETAFLLELGFDCAAIEAGLERARRFEEIDIQR